MLILLLHHFLFLWLRAHLLSLSLCNASPSMQVVCGDFTAMETAKEVDSDALGGFDVTLRHPAMFGDQVDLVEGFKYAVTFASRNDAMEVQGVAIIATSTSTTTTPTPTGDSAPSPPALLSARRTEYRCDHHPAKPIPPTPVQSSSASYAGYTPAPDQSTRPSTYFLREAAAAEGEFESSALLLPSSESASIPGVTGFLSSSSSSPASLSSSEMPLSSSVTTPLTALPAGSSSSSLSVLSPSVVLSSSLSSLGSSLTTTKPTPSASSLSTPELVSSLPTERLGEHLPYSLTWTADAVLPAPCLTLTFVVLVNSSVWTQRSRQLCKPTGCKRYFTNDTGIVRSPGFPAPYPDSSDCTYIIYTNASSRLELQFQTFQLENVYSKQCVDSVNMSSPHSAARILCGQYDVTQLRHLNYFTDDDTLVLRFVSDNKFSSKGFEAVYATAQSKACDIFFRQLNGTITSPTFPSTGTYLPNMACNFSVLLPDSYRTRFYIRRFNLSDPATGACTDRDFLRFRDLESQSETTLTACGGDDVTSGDLVFESSGSRVEVVFESDHVYQGEGFEVFYVGVPSCLNETYNATRGSVSSVNFPSSYPNMQECFYTINVGRKSSLGDDDYGDVGDDDDDGDNEGDGDNGDVIEVTFREFITESDSDGDARLRDELCLRDFVEILDGTDKHKICGDWTGKEQLLYFRFRSRSVIFRFVSDERETRRGFNATWRAIKGDKSDRPCLTTWVDTTNFGFQVVYHPQTWEDGEADCASRGGHLVSILNASTQSHLSQHLLQQTCSNALAYWIGGNDRQWESDFYWPDQTKVNFTNWFPGFELSEEGGWRYGQQPSDDGVSDEDCVEMRRHFTMPEKGQITTETFYWNDRSCRQKNPYICQVKPRMVSPPTVRCDKSVELSDAHPEVRLRSPGYPHDYYPDHTNCTYFIHAPLNAMLEVEFWDFHLEDVAVTGGCDYDFVEVTSNAIAGESREDRLCGDWSTKVKLLRQVVPRFYTFLHFRADHSKRFPGFDVTVRIAQGYPDCASGVWLPVSEGCVQLLPKQSLPQIDRCASISASLWAPETDEELPVILTHVLSAAAEVPEANAKNKLEMMILNTDKKMCERITSSETEYFDNITLVTQMTRSSVYCNTSGLPAVCFKERKTETREERFLVDAVNRTEGFLQPVLASDDVNYTNDAFITWTLQAAPGQRLLLLFDDVELEDQEQCLYDSIVVTNSTPAGPVCGTWGDGYAVVSQDNVTEVSFRSDYSVTGAAFGLSWQSLDMAQCRSQIFTETSAAFTSFNFPRPFPDSLRCFVIIQVEPGFRVQLQFTRVVLYDSSEQSIAVRLGGTGGEDEVKDEMGEEAGEVGGEEELMIGVTDDDEQGSTLGRVFLSYGNEVVVRLERSALLADEGFQATYKSVPRPSALVLDTDRLEPNSSSAVLSTNFPLPFPDLFTLDYTLRAPIGYLIHVTFHHFRLPSSNECSDAVEIYDVSLAGRKVAGRPRMLTKLCGGPEGSVNDTVSELNSIRLVMTAGNRSELEEGSRMRRSVGAPDEVVGFNISLSVYPDPDYLEKTSSLAGATFDSCAESPCLHNGTCTERDNRGSCTCLLHYTGLFCQVTWCEIDTCLHGDCFLTDSKPGYRCQCFANHFGEQCQMNKSQCRKHVCHGAGECTESSHHPQCICDDDKPERTGLYCNVTVISNLNKTIGQRLLGEPIWIGLIVILSVLCLFGVVCVVRRRCAKRYACCQLQFKRKEPEGTHLGDGKRAGLEAGSHPMTTFNFRRTLLRPLSNPSVNSTAPPTPTTLRAPPTISVTKAADDVTPAPPTSRRIPDELKAEVAARFFASYREAERAPISTPLPTDFSKTTDTFLAQTSEEPPTVGAIVGGTLLLDLHHRKNRDDLMSRSTVSLGPHGHHRRSSSSATHREKIKRCNSTGPYLLRQNLSSTSSQGGSGAFPADDIHLSHSRSPARSRSLDDGDSVSMGSEPDAVFGQSPWHPRSMSASPVMQRSLHVRTGSSVAGGDLSKNSDNDDFNEDEGAVATTEERRAGVQYGQHLFPEVVVHVVDCEREGEDGMSDYSHKDSPTKTAATSSGCAASRPAEQNMDTEKPSSRLHAGDIEGELGRLHHCRSESALVTVGRANDSGMADSKSEAILRFKDEVLLSTPSRGVMARNRSASPSFNEQDMSGPGTSSRRKHGFYMDAFGSDDMAGTDSPPSYLPVRREHPRRHLVHQHTMDSYFEQRSDPRQPHKVSQAEDTAGYYPRKARADAERAALRHSNTSPVVFHSRPGHYRDEMGVGERAVQDHGLSAGRHRRKETRADEARDVSHSHTSKQPGAEDRRRPYEADDYQPGPSRGERRHRQPDPPATYDPRAQSGYSSEHRHHHHRSRRSPKHQQQQQQQQQHVTARDRRGLFKRNETVAVPPTSNTPHRRRGSKRRGHAHQPRKSSSVDFLGSADSVNDLDPHLVPHRSHSEDTLDACQCEECVARTPRPSTSVGTPRSSRHIQRGDSVSSGHRRYKTRDKATRERRDAYRHKSPRTSGDGGTGGSRSSRRPHFHTSESCSSPTRPDSDPHYTKTPSSESDKVLEKMSAAGRQRGNRAMREADFHRRRGIDALGSSSSDKDQDMSKRELFMKFFSQGVDADDAMSPDEFRFFKGDVDPVRAEALLCQQVDHPSAPAAVPGALGTNRDSPVPTLQDTNSRSVWHKCSDSVNSPSYQNRQTESPHHQRLTVESTTVHDGKQRSCQLADGRETLTVTPYTASNTPVGDPGGAVRKPAALTSKCSVIIYDDDLRIQGGTRSVSVSNKVSPCRTPPVQREAEKTASEVSDPLSVAVDVERKPRFSPPADRAGGSEGDPRLKVLTTTDNDSSGSSEMTTTHPQNSYPPSLLSVTTDTDSAVSSAHSRQASPFYDVVNTSTSPNTAVTQATTKAKDSAYQTKESSVDMFEVARDTRWRKPLPAASRSEDRRVTQKLHQAAVKLYILQQVARKSRLSRDSAVNTISEDETNPDDDQWYPPRYTVLNRKQVSSLEGRMLGVEGEAEQEYRINEEEEHDSDLDLRGGLNPTPEILCPVTTENIMEEPHDLTECDT